jgi:hypothetical protein
MSNGIYVSRQKAEAASRKPQHFSKHTSTIRPVNRWLHFLWGDPATARSIVYCGLRRRQLAGMRQNHRGTTK